MDIKLQTREVVLQELSDYGRKFATVSSTGAVFIHEIGGPKSRDPDKHMCVLLTSYELDKIIKERARPFVECLRSNDV